MAQQMKVTGRSTTITTRDGVTRITYHSTDVVSIDHAQNRVTLDSGGWRSSTTKTRMNQASHQFGLGFQVYQKDFDWFVDFNGGTSKFYDRMSFPIS